MQALKHVGHVRCFLSLNPSLSTVLFISMPTSLSFIDPLTVRYVNTVRAFSDTGTPDTWHIDRGKLGWMHGYGPLVFVLPHRTSVWRISRVIALLTTPQQIL